jgi:hypothetical protein
MLPTVRFLLAMRALRKIFVVLEIESEEPTPDPFMIARSVATVSVKTDFELAPAADPLERLHGAGRGQILDPRSKCD